MLASLLLASLFLYFRILIYSTVDGDLTCSKCREGPVLTELGWGMGLVTEGTHVCWSIDYGSRLLVVLARLLENMFNPAPNHVALLSVASHVSRFSSLFL